MKGATADAVRSAQEEAGRVDIHTWSFCVVIGTAGACTWRIDLNPEAHPEFRSGHVRHRHNLIFEEVRVCLNRVLGGSPSPDGLAVFRFGMAMPYGQTCVRWSRHCWKTESRLPGNQPRAFGNSGAVASVAAAVASCFAASGRQTKVHSALGRPHAAHAGQGSE